MSDVENFRDDEGKSLSKLSKLLREKEEEIKSLKSEILHLQNERTKYVDGSTSNDKGLSNSEIERYSRQILIPQIGVGGQLHLKRTSVLIVGAGGLGCPAAMYLAAAGVGTIGIVDHDEVEVSNLHRQVFHSESNLGVPKSISLVNALKSINSSGNYIPYNLQLRSENAKDIIQNYDIIIDASDNVPTRYLINDASVLLKKPLVSGSALRLEGQLTLYNYENAPCYRCLYPHPPPPSTITNCSDGGVLGPVTGVIGSLQALEAIKLAVGMPTTFKNKMLVFDGECAKFRVFNLRGKNPSCEICGKSPTIKDLIDYEEFCKTSAFDKCMKIKLLCDKDRITCAEYKKIVDSKTPHILIDVRPSYEFDICSLPNCINVPLNSMLSSLANEIRNAVETCGTKTVYVVCRRGNDSQKAVQLLHESLQDLNLNCCDIKGGLQAWHYEVDNKFPLY